MEQAVLENRWRQTVKTPHTNKWYSNPKFPDAHTVKSHSTVLKEAEHYNKINLNRGISVLNNDFGTLTKQCHNRQHDKTKFSHLKDGDGMLLMNDRKKNALHYMVQKPNYHHPSTYLQFMWWDYEQVRLYTTVLNEWMNVNGIIGKVWMEVVVA